MPYGFIIDNSFAKNIGIGSECLLGMRIIIFEYENIRIRTRLWIHSIRRMLDVYWLTVLSELSFGKGAIFTD